MSLYDELLDEINKKVTHNREEYENNQNKRTKSNSRRKAYDSAESTKLINNNVLPTRKQYMPNEHTNNINDLPVANEFRRQLETGKRVQPQEEYSLPVFSKRVKDNILPTVAKGVLDESSYVAKKIGAGILSGATGIAQAGTTDVANNFEKAKQKNANEITSNLLNSFVGLANPAGALNNTITGLPKLVGNTIKTISDKDKNFLEKGTSLITSAISEGLNNNSARNFINSSTQALGKVLPDNASEKVLEINNIISDPSNRLNEQLEKERGQHFKFTQTAGDVGQVVGNMVPSIVVGTITKNPQMALATMGISAKGQSTQEALNKGATLDEAVKIGDTKAMIEVGTEMLTGGVNIFGKGALDDIIERGITNKVKNEVASTLIKQGMNISGEVLEETISDVLGTVIDKGTVDPNATYSIQDWGDTALTTTLSTLVLNAITGGIGSIGNKIHNNNIQKNTQNNKEVLPTQQIIQEDNRVAQNGNMEQVKPIANNKQTLYNSIESEGGIDGEIQGLQRLSGQFDTRLQQKEKSQQTKRYTREEYQQWEQSIKPIEERSLTNEQRQVKDNIKRQYNKDIVFFDSNDSNYNGGASLENSSKIYINTNDINEFGLNRVSLHETIESDIRHNKSLKEDIINPTIDKIINDSNFQAQKEQFWKEQDGEIPNDYAIAKDILCDRFAEVKSGEKLDYDNVLSQETNMNIDYAIDNFYKEIRNKNIETVAPIAENLGSFSSQKNNNKILNPTEIANLTLENANTTPELKKKNYARGNKESNFLSNITTDAGFLNEDLRKEMSTEDNIRYYKGITNEQTLEKAFTELQNGGEQETLRWFNSDNKNIKAEDVAKGWILLKQYQDSGDYQGAVEVAKKMRDMGTNAGQAVQAYNILARLTPEGMFYYAQSELSEAYNKMAQGKSKEWIEENSSKFDLTPEETQFIKEKMESIQKTDDERTKKITLAEIQKVISDKIPPTASQSIKAWMRISMLFNPKTQVRNVLGNAVILPVNTASDMISSGLDKVIAKKTGVRTTGMTNIKNYAKGFGKGVFESYEDFRKGINTRNIEGNRFEVSEGKSFKDKNIGKALNRVDNLLSFALDVGDRGFYEATFTNSINNQLVLNNTTEVTQNMIDIATNEALQRTWQDNNAYTNAVLKIRNILNIGKGYGLGDVLIPFAKTPANLTKAIVDYSPVGLTKTLAVDAKKFKNSLENGQYTPQMQHQFVQNLGKGMAGSFLYVLGYALAKAGVATGESDDDKDVKNFMKNSLGISSYSLKIGDKTFTYDWAQPVATPLAIMTNYVKYSKDNPDANALEKIWKSMNIGTEQLLQQSFMESLNTVLNGNGTTLENLSQAILELPARAIPTFSKQVADMIDPIQRTSFEYNKPFQSAVNSIKAKIPGLSQTLPTSIDTLGNDIKKYGGDNSLWNVMFNPANMNKGKLSKAGQEIYKLYMQTGDTTIFPRVAPYYINSKGNKITMSSYQRSEFQKVTGKYVESALTGLLNNRDYKKLSNEKKADVINQIVSDSYSKAKYDILKIDSEEYEKLRNTLSKVSTTSYYDYKFKTKGVKKDSEKIDVIVNANYTEKEKTTIYENYIKSKDDKNYEIIKSTGLNINTYLKYKLADSNKEFSADKKDDGTVKGKSITNSAKDKRYNYIKNMDATYMQKAVLFGLEASPSKTDKATIVNYISSLEGKTNKEKLDMLGRFSWITIYKNGTFNF